MKIEGETRDVALHMSEIFKAYSEGKEIWKKDENGDLMIKDIENIIQWCNYDVNSLYIKETPKHRPYRFAEEFLQAQKEHGPYLGEYRQFHNVTFVDDECIVICSRNGLTTITYEELINMYTWQDCTPCGVEETK